MNKKSLIIIGAVVLVAIIIVGIYVYTKPCVIASEDGQITLKIKRSALPKHVSKDDIKITKVESKNFPFKLGEEEPLYIYDFQPDGLYFLKPIDFEVNIPNEQNVLPVIYNVSEYGITRLDDVEVTLDTTNKTANIIGTTEHFSSFYMMQDSFTMSLTSPQEAFVGKSFQVSGLTQRVPRAVRVEMVSDYEASRSSLYNAMYEQWKDAAAAKGLHGDVEVGEITYSEPWELEGTMTGKTADVIKPTKIEQAPKKTKVEGGDPLGAGPGSYEYKGTFTCINDGLATFRYTVQIYPKAEIKWQVNPPFDIDFGDLSKPMTVKQISHTLCKVAPPEEGNGDGNGTGNGEEEGEEEGEAEEEEELEAPEEECPDCDALEEQLEDLEAKREELQKEIENKEQELKDAEFTEEILDQEIDNVINDAGCNPNQDPGGGASKSGESSGTVTSRGRAFFCPSEAAAEALVKALKEFFKDQKTPSQVRHELRILQKKMDKLDFEIQGVKAALEDCPCEKFVLADPITIETELVSLDLCSEHIQTLKLMPSSKESVEYKIEEDYEWFDFNPAEGSLPQDVAVNLNCTEVKKLEPGTHTATTEIAIFDKDKKKIKGVPVNMIFGMMLIEGEEGKTTDETPVAVSTDFIEFFYDHSNPLCPLNIEPVQVSGPVGGTWQVVSEPPMWLDFDQMSGPIPGQIDMNFPCRLNRYEDQEQTTNVKVETKTPTGQTQEFNVQVKGKFMNF